MVSVKVRGEEKLLAILSGFKTKNVKERKLAFGKATYTLEKRILYYLSGRRGAGKGLNRKTGRLAGSLRHRFTENEGRVWTDVKYAATHEFGKTIPSHTVFPVRRQALHFEMRGAEVFAKKAIIPTFRMPKRATFAPALQDERERIIDFFRKANKRSL